MDDSLLLPIIGTLALSGGLVVPGRDGRRRRREPGAALGPVRARFAIGPEAAAPPPLRSSDASSTTEAGSDENASGEAAGRTDSCTRSALVEPIDHGDSADVTIVRRVAESVGAARTAGIPSTDTATSTEAVRSVDPAGSNASTVSRERVVSAVSIRFEPHIELVEGEAREAQRPAGDAGEPSSGTGCDAGEHPRAEAASNTRAHRDGALERLRKAASGFVDALPLPGRRASTDARGTPPVPATAPPGGPAPSDALAIDAERAAGQRFHEILRDLRATATSEPSSASQPIDLAATVDDRSSSDRAPSRTGGDAADRLPSGATPADDDGRPRRAVIEDRATIASADDAGSLGPAFSAHVVSHRDLRTGARNVPLTRLPLRPVSDRIRWTRFVVPPLDEPGVDERRAVLLRALERPERRLPERALLGAWDEERGPLRTLALRLLVRGETAPVTEALRDALRTGTEDERALAIDAFAAAGRPEELAEALGDRSNAIVARATLAMLRSRRRRDHAEHLEHHLDPARRDAVLGLLAGILE